MNLPNIIVIIAPIAAPLETPINPGSTSGFLKRPWSIAPDVPRPAPTKIASIILGNLILSKTVWCIFEKLVAWNFYLFL